MPNPICPLCGAPLPLVLDATTGRCPGCGFDFGRMLNIFAQPAVSAAAPPTFPDKDSLETVEMVMVWEESFERPIPPAELENLQSVQDVLNLMKKYGFRPPEKE